MGPTDNFLLTLVLGSRGKSLKSRFEPQGLLLVKPQVLHRQAKDKELWLFVQDVEGAGRPEHLCSVADTF